MALTKKGNTKLPLLTPEERTHHNARGFYIVNSTNPLPTGATAYKLVINTNAVITGYSERKSNGGGNVNMLVKRNLSGITLISGREIYPPKNNPCSALTVSSGSIICYLEDSI